MQSEILAEPAPSPAQAGPQRVLQWTGEGAGSPAGLKFHRRFTRPGVDPFDAVEWEVRDAVITDSRGGTVFEQRGVEVPRPWSQTATNVVVSKYFRGGPASRGPASRGPASRGRSGSDPAAPETPERERSVRQVIGRVSDAIARWGAEGGYFAGAEDGEVFHQELRHVLLNQQACFNSPVWFNVGIEPRPQCSACFINSVEDTMPSILELVRTEGMLFKYGSGTGSNLSTIRSSREELSGGGTASGPVSFMKGFDAFAGVIKSGGKTRRAAKMVILDVDHPDIEEFVRCKEIEEQKARVLAAAGYLGNGDGLCGAEASLFYQNANHSVRVSDEFMRSVVEDGEWSTRSVTDGRPVEVFPARELMRKIARAAWACGDPGLQFDTTINAWNTCPRSDRIRASNPCSEYMFLDDSACNLASINLMRFHRGDGFDVEGFRHVCEVMITAQEILVDNASYPTDRIRDNSRRFRPLGLGYSNLGALLMAYGLPYDSDAGRDLAAGLTALMSGTAYAQSARIAAGLGPFEAFEENREPMLQVLKKHRDAMARIGRRNVPEEILAAAEGAWGEAIAGGEGSGVRNAQISVLAPTGTIAFMMDCDTTGIEPDLALVKYRKLIDGGRLKITNRTVELALAELGYDGAEVEEILAYLEENDTIEGAPHLAAEHLPVFDCALRPIGGRRSIHYRGHLEMLAAVQPFLSGAISKTINMPHEATPEEIFDAYLEAWRLGVKAVAIYRDGCKHDQPLSPGGTAVSAAAAGGAAAERSADKPAAGESPAARRRLPDERRAITHKFSINQHKGYITVGLYEDGRPGEIFLVMAKEGSTVSGLMDCFATTISIALQWGVPLKPLVDKFSHTRFEPSGFTNNPQIPIAKSIADYIFRWLGSKFLDPDAQKSAGLILLENGESSNGEAPSSGAEPAAVAAPPPAAAAGAGLTFLPQQDAPGCHVCGSIMVRAGSCYECLNCGATSGCS